MVAVVEAELLKGCAKGWERSVSANALRSRVFVIGLVLQAVPVRPRPSASTRIGTTRRHSRRLMSVSAVKMSVMGFGVYGWKAIVVVGCRMREPGVC